MDELAGDGLLVGGGRPVPVEGMVGGAVAFDGVDDFLAAPDLPQLNLGPCVPARSGSDRGSRRTAGEAATAGLCDLTIELWLRTTRGTGLQVLIDKRGVGTAASPAQEGSSRLQNAASNHARGPVRGYALYLLDGRPGFQTVDGAVLGNFVSPGGVADGAWHHVAVTLDRSGSNQGRLYVDGAAVLGFSPPSGDLSNGAEARIGGLHPSPARRGEGAFEGALDEITLIGRPLSPQEVGAIFKVGTIGKCKAPPKKPFSPGIAELHHHMFSEQIFGGAWMHGTVNGPLVKCDGGDPGDHARLKDDLSKFLDACPNIPIIDDIRERFREVPLIGGELDNAIVGLFEGVGGLASGVIGATDGSKGDTGKHLERTIPFDHWPRWDSIAHQQSYWNWLKDAHDGGLNLVVVSATTFGWFCELLPPENRRPGATCNEMEDVELQLKMANDFANDQANTGWVEIATTPAHARSIIAAGKLAMVLSIESSHLFDDPTTLSDALAKLDTFRNQYNVRTLQPVHQLDNVFAGAAPHNIVFHVAQFMDPIVGEPCHVDFDCAITFKGDELLLCQPTPSLTLGFNVEWVDSDGDGHYSGPRECRNTRGLTPLGKDLIQAMMDRGMLIDLAHMSEKSVEDAFDKAKQNNYYPLYISHGHFRDIMSRSKAEHEKTTPVSIARIIRQTGGIFGLRTDHNETREYIPSVVDNSCQGSSRSFAQAYDFGRLGLKVPMAFGADLNGFIQQTRPRFYSEYEVEVDSKTKVVPNGACAAGFDAEGHYQAYQQKFGPPPLGSELDTKGFAHIGLLPDLVRDLDQLGVDTTPLQNSADTFIRMWERAVGSRSGPADPAADLDDVPPGEVKAILDTIAPYVEKDVRGAAYPERCGQRIYVGWQELDRSCRFDEECQSGHCTAGPCGFPKGECVAERRYCGSTLSEWQALGGAVTIFDHSGSPSGQTITGTFGPDLIIGSAFADTIVGDAGSDCIYGLDGADVIRGGSGCDVIFGGDAGDAIDGDDDPDFIFGSGANVPLSVLDVAQLCSVLSGSRQGPALEPQLGRIQTIRQKMEELIDAGGALIADANGVFLKEADDLFMDTDAGLVGPAKGLGAEGNAFLVDKDAFMGAAKTGLWDNADQFSQDANTTMATAGSRFAGGEGSPLAKSAGRLLAEKDVLAGEAGSALAKAEGRFAGSGAEAFMAEVDARLVLAGEGLTASAEAALLGAGGACSQASDEAALEQTGEDLNARADAELVIPGEKLEARSETELVARGDAYSDRADAEVVAAGDATVARADAGLVAQGDGAFLDRGDDFAGQAELLAAEVMSLFGEGDPLELSADRQSEHDSPVVNEGVASARSGIQCVLPTTVNRLSGGQGLDIIIGTDANDLIEGGDGFDIMIGLSGDDLMRGNDQFDIILGLWGNDYIQGGGGTDFLAGNWGDDCLFGEEGWDIMFGDLDRTVLFARTGTEGNDYLKGGDDLNTTGDRDHDIMFGNCGDDEMHGGDDIDVMFGNGGNDAMYGGRGSVKILGPIELGDLMFGNRGDDTMCGGESDPLGLTCGALDLGGDVMFGNKGNDTLRGGSGVDFMFGNRGNDVMYGEAGSSVTIGGVLVLVGNLMFGNSDNDTMHGSGILPFDDIMFGNSGDDRMYGGAHMFIELMFGNDGNDELQGASIDGIDGLSVELIFGNQGNDTMYGDSPGGLIGGVDVMFGNRGADTMDGGVSADLMFGNQGRDTMYGDSPGALIGGLDLMFGNNGDDVMRGGPQPDLMFGNQGNDVMDGGGGVPFDLMFGNQGNDLMHGDENAVIDGGDIMFGNRGNDTMHGDGTFPLALDLMFGNCGDDVMYGSTTTFTDAGINVMFGNRGNDTMHGAVSIVLDIMFGNSDSDFMDGHGGPDLMWGNDCADEMHGGGGLPLDLMFGNKGDDLMFGEGDVDVMFGNRGEDRVDGGDGLDILFGNSDRDVVSGGDGLDVIFGNDSDDNLSGDDGLDVILGNSGNDQIAGGSDADVILGNSGNDLISGGGEADLIFGNSESDTIAGGGGLDVIFGNDQDDAIDGGTEGDVIFGNDGVDVIRGGTGGDVIFGNRDGDAIDGEGNGDLIFGNRGADTIFGDDGNDILFGNDDADCITAGPNNDTVFGNRDNDWIDGGGGRNLLFGNRDHDTMRGGNDKDLMFGNRGNDSMAGGGDKDLMFGNRDGDVLLGEGGNDLMFGNRGEDDMDGGSDNDVLFGNRGNDHLYGGPGTNALFGGRGNDSNHGDNSCTSPTCSVGDTTCPSLPTGGTTGGDDCHPTADGLSCEKETSCPGSTGCLRTCISFVPGREPGLPVGLQVLDCDCRTEGNCHVGLGSKGPYCIDRFTDDGKTCVEKRTVRDDRVVNLCCAEEPAPEPVACQPTAEGDGCQDPGGLCSKGCQPTCANYDPCSGESAVIGCDCVGPDDCHVEITPGKEPQCVGNVPAGFVCKEVRTESCNPDGSNLCCEVQAKSPMPNADGTGCAPFTCPVEGQTYGPTTVSSTGQVTACDCLSEGTDECRLTVDPLAGPSCGGECRDGQQCQLTSSGGASRCGCVAVGCQPTLDGSGCNPAPCDDPAKTCIPTAVMTQKRCAGGPVCGTPCSSDGDCPESTCVEKQVVAECDCVGPNECQIEGDPATDPQCAGTCETDEICELRSFSGVVTCECEDQECEPTDDGRTCRGRCQGQECFPTEIAMIQVCQSGPDERLPCDTSADCADGAPCAPSPWIVDCECVTNECHVVINPVAGPTCAGTCERGNGCELIVQGDLNEPRDRATVQQFLCDCVPTTCPLVNDTEKPCASYSCTGRRRCQPVVPGDNSACECQSGLTPAPPRSLAGIR